MDTTYADILTVIAPQRAGTRFDQYDNFLLMCPDDAAGAWFIYGDREGHEIEEIQGPFSTRKAARSFLRHGLLTVCARPVLEVR